ncbi:MAG: right-handed parallel beta-helix repeat-containing protein [Chloroflexota bacterium]
MRSHRQVALAAISALLMLCAAAPASAASVGSRTTRWVDDDGKAGPSSCGGSRSASTKIQSAINKSDRNDVVIVCPGSYTGLIEISGARDGLTVRGYSKWTAVVKPPASLVDGPLVWMQNVSSVTLQGLVLQFPSTGCRTHVADLYGVWARNVDGLRVIGNRLRTSGAATLGDCGYDDGIRVVSSTGVRVSNNTVRDFQSDGISFEDASRGTIDGNSIQFYHTDAGASDDGDQGIRIVDGSRAVVEDNSIRSHSGSGRPHLEIGIVVDDGSGTSEIRGNDVAYTETGIGVLGSRAQVISNSVTGTNARRGIHLLDGTGSEVVSNRIRSYDIGIEVESSTGNTLRKNDASGNVTQGCVDTTSGDGTAGTGNTWTSNIGTPDSAPVEICPAA